MGIWTWDSCQMLWPLCWNSSHKVFPAEQRMRKWGLVRFFSRYLVPEVPRANLEGRCFPGDAPGEPQAGSRSLPSQMGLREPSQVRAYWGQTDWAVDHVSLRQTCKQLCFCTSAGEYTLRGHRPLCKPGALTPGSSFLLWTHIHYSVMSSHQVSRMAMESFTHSKPKAPWGGRAAPGGLGLNYGSFLHHCCP